MIQIVLQDPKWRAKLTDEDRRSLSDLFWDPSLTCTDACLELDMSSHLDLDAGEQGAT